MFVSLLFKNVEISTRLELRMNPNFPKKNNNESKLGSQI